MNTKVKELAVSYLLTAPLLIIVTLAPFLRQNILRMTYYNVPATNLIMGILLVTGGIGCGVLYMVITLNAQKAVSGRRFLVGVVYERDGVGREFQVELGTYSFIKTIEYDGTNYHIYAVWKIEKGKRVIDYVLLIDKLIEEALSAASEWEIYIAGWYATAQVYPVTALKMYGNAIDVIRESVKLDQRVDIYLLRDYPGRLGGKNV